MRGSARLRNDPRESPEGTFFDPDYAPCVAQGAVKFALRRLYYRQHAYACEHGAFCADAAALLGDEAALYDIRAYVTPSMFEGIAQFGGETYHIDQDGYLWKGEKY